MKVRAIEPADAEAWRRMRTRLWPEWPEDHGPEIRAFFEEAADDVACFVAEGDGGALVGFAEVALRRSAEGCDTTPVGYLEGIRVERGSRRSGVAAALVAACEAWARDRGAREMGSDRAPENEASGRFHEAVGYREVGRIVCYRKEL